MNISKLDGCIDGDRLLFSDAAGGVLVTRAVSAAMPSIENASQGLLNQIELALQLILRLLDPDMKLQILCKHHSELTDILNTYYEETLRLNGNEWSNGQRNALYIRLNDLMGAGQLRHFDVQLYVSKVIESKGGGQPCNVAIEAATKSLDTPLAEIAKAFERCGGQARLMTGKDLSKALWRHFNPHQDGRKWVPNIEANPEKTIIENYLGGDFVPMSGEGAHLYYNGAHHAFVLMGKLPQATTSGMIAPLCALPLTGYAMNVRIKPMNVNAVVLKEEREIAKLKRALHSSIHTGIASTIEMKEERIKRALNGDVVPFGFQFYTHVWAESQDELQEKLGVIQMSFYQLNGASPYLVSLPTSCRNAFFACMPGSSYEDRAFTHYIEDLNLAHLLPVCGNKLSSENSYEALFNGTNGSVHGVNTFRGNGEDIKPLPAFVTGQMGSGKSCLVIELLTQTEPYYDFTVILDNGNSYGCYVKTYQGSVKSIFLQGHGEVTLNYLSTQGCNLNAEKMDAVTKIMVCMTGSFGSERSERVALIFKLVSEFYHHFASDWKLSSPERERISWEMAYTRMSESEQPTHSDFHNWLEGKLGQNDFYEADINRLVLLLARWRRDRGGYTLFDGQSNVSFEAEVVHLELSKLRESSPELNSVATHVITNMIHGHIMSLPRGGRKRVVVEELGAFCDIPGGQAIVRDFYERSRKYNCWVVSVIQQISLLPDDLAVSILGNSRQAFILRQEFEQDARVLQKAFNLPDSAIQNLMRFPDPNRENGAPFLHWISEGERKRVVTAFNIASPEMLYVSSSAGEHFEKRERALANYTNILEGIEIESRKSE